jgi:hypothetical protein
LLTEVPRAWQAARVTQGERDLKVAVTDRVIRYDAVPGGGTIVIRPIR